MNANRAVRIALYSSRRGTAKMTRNSSSLNLSPLSRALKVETSKKYLRHSKRIFFGSNCSILLSQKMDVSKFVVKHSSTDRIAIFGGDPSRRRQTVEKKLAPFQSLDQFGSEKQGETSNLIRQIKGGKFNVVYVWTRFNCHGSRYSIREACLKAGTRFEEVNSLSYIQYYNKPKILTQH